MALPYYEVRRKTGGRWFRLQAKNAQDAKRRYCHLFGIRPSDPWTGIENLQARKVKEARHGD
ncbi:MAG: hypothetical protein K6T83_07915 [Alicyclobacillus sp.]|nr:hypothetical protein [Alicyclobacillus sp.]